MYEIMNDLGANVAAVEDDNQNAYMNMDDYINLERVEKFWQAKKAPKYDLSKVKTREKDEKDFSKAWKAGLKMKWDYVPLEDQKTHINWRQSINDDGSHLKRLASWPCSEANAGANTVDTSPASLMQKNRDAMESYGGGNATVKNWINAGRNAESMKDRVLNWVQGSTHNQNKAKCDANTDALIVESLCVCENNSDFDSVLSKYNNCASEMSTSNPAVVITAYGIGSDRLKKIIGNTSSSGGSGGGGGDGGYNMPTQSDEITAQVGRLKPGWKDALPKIGAVLKNKFGLDCTISSAARSESHNAAVGGVPNSYHIDHGNGGDAVDIVLPDNTSDSTANEVRAYFKSTGSFAEVLFHDIGSGYHLHLGGLKDAGSLDSAGGSSINTILWVDFAEKLASELGTSEKGELFPQVCYLYCKARAECSNCRFDEDNMGFPFTDEELKNPGVTYVGCFGESRPGHYHKGIDLAVAENTPIHACHDGTVTAAGDGWGSDDYAVNINHGDGTYSRYLHCNGFKVSKGQQVKRGDVIALSGNRGHSSGPHLHLEISPGQSEVSTSTQDPLDWFPKFKGAISLGSQVTPA